MVKEEFQDFINSFFVVFQRNRIYDLNKMQPLFINKKNLKYF